MGCQHSWLTWWGSGYETNFYVEVNSMTSIFYDSKSGIIQGSILGPILCTIYVAPLFDLFNFAKDNFTLAVSKNKQHAIELLIEKLTLIKKWLKDSGLSINQNKT